MVVKKKKNIFLAPFGACRLDYTGIAGMDATRVVGKCCGDRLRLEPIVVSFLSQRGIDRQNRACRHREELELGGPLNKHGEDCRFLDRLTRSQLAVVS